tara:strand:- start:311 stop:544 length:234 start_codon:yes stop_codon:yes gene_type:complete
MADKNEKTGYTEDSVFNNNMHFYYYYRSDNEKHNLQKLICKDLIVFHKTVCLYEKNKDNPNCGDLSEYLKQYCKSFT